MPRWAKAFGIIAVALVVLVVVMLVVGGGQHGPGRHSSPDDRGRHVPPPGVTEGHTPP